MTAYDLLFLVTCFLLLLIILGIVADGLLAPEEERWPEYPMCRCGQRGGGRVHRHD